MNSKATVPQEAACPQCQSVIPEDAPKGICPVCVIELGLSSANEPTRTDFGGEKRMPGAFQAPDFNELNEKFEHLDVSGLLGQGGMGAVYRAKQISLDRDVALKILPPYAGSDPSFLERFQREARALARLTHPNIVMVFEFGQIDDMFFFVMELVDGVNLREAIEAGGLTTREALNVVPQICEALQFAHDEGIVHRDIKPENIMLDSRGRVKITDFGLAKLLEQNAINFTLTSTNQVLGTLKYMAPEQIENPMAVDHRSDIYSLGVVFYELLTGELPLGRFDPPSKVRSSDQSIDPVVMRTLEKQPAQRFQQASEVKTAVESIMIDDPSVPPQKEIPKTGAEKKKKSRSGVRRLPSVSFQLTKVFGGLGRGKGLMRVDFEAEEILLDVEIKDILGGLFRSEFKQIRISFEHVLAFNFEFSWYSQPQLNIQTDYFAEFAKLPGAENGCVQLVFESKERKAASQLCEQIEKELEIYQDEPEPETEDPLNDEIIENSRERLKVPSVLCTIAGFTDIIVAILVWFGVVGMLGQRNDQDVVPMIALVAVAYMAIGIFELYLGRCLRNLQNLWVLIISMPILTLLWPHFGTITLLPATIWMFALIFRRPFFRCFDEVAKREENHRIRTSLTADSAEQFELRTMLFWPIAVLFVVGSLGTLISIAALIGATWSDKFTAFNPIAVFTVFSALMLGAALLMTFNPSVYWGHTVAKLAKAPLHIFFPITFFVGRSIQKKLYRHEDERHGGNPYVEKGEGITQIWNPK